MSHLAMRVIPSAWKACFMLIASVAGANFDNCRIDVENMLTRNGTIPLNTNSSSLANDFDFDPIYHGDLYGFDPSAATRPLTLTLQGCETICGPKPDLNGVLDAFQILTTWVLPAVALLSSLPYDSLGRRKRKNIEAFLNWFGAPAATLTTTLHNIVLIRECSLLSNAPRDQSLRPYAKDAYYVLSCINQYEFPGPGSDKTDEWKRRNTALLRGTLWPLLIRGDASGEIPEARWQQLRTITSNLAFQLRMQRRKAVWPLAVTIVWFVIAFVISVVTAFADLGNNTKAHSLALGLLLFWLPVVVVMAIVDRNPVSAKRCAVLIERWLYNVDKILSAAPSTTPDLWNQRSDASSFHIGEFVGQGRRLRYCGVAKAVLRKIQDSKNPHLQLRTLESNPDFEKALKKRSWSWWISWITSQIIVASAFSMAFLVSFNTPTIGLGCRSLLYLVWYLVSSISWWILAFWQEPSNWVRRFSWAPNTCAAFLLALIMGFQLTNGLNNCLCKSSVFGSTTYGGYMDFENGTFYHRAYHVQRYWIPGAIFGFVSCMLPIGWAVRQWSKRSSLWKTEEDSLPENMDIMRLDWLT